jgi:hypothetical protein
MEVRIERLIINEIEMKSKKRWMFSWQDGIKAPYSSK